MKRKTNKSSDLKKFVVFCALIIIGFWLGLNKDRLPGLLLNSLAKRTASVKLSADEKISPKELKKILDSKDFTLTGEASQALLTGKSGQALLINVHTPYEGEIGATDSFIDYDLLVANKDKLPRDKNAAIILYCKTGRMSAEAIETLKDLGYTNVSHLEGGMDAWKKEGLALLDLSGVPSSVLPEGGFELPIAWGDLGPKLVALGVIEKGKFDKAVNMTDEQKAILYQGSNNKITIDAQNSQFVVDLLWALGLSQKSLVYDEGPMGKEYKGKESNFASTAGWTLSRGTAMDHYNKHVLISLSADQQKKVMEIATNVYRPCCGNHTAFPDCNHGMAALAAIELMVAKGMTDDEIYRNVLKLNSFWFPQNYLTIATYFARQGISWDNVDAKLALGAEYSGGQGAAALNQKVGPLPFDTKIGGSCGA